MAEEFEQEELEKILQEVASCLTNQTNIYLFGGAVMVYNKLKPSTKDIDILFKEEKDYQEFLNAAQRAGFMRTRVPLEYSHFDMSDMLRHPETEWRLDLFHKKVCKKFCFNLDVEKRSKFFKEFNKLKVFFIAFEDIFLMKSLTERDRDLDDMNNILGFGLDFKALLKEIENQGEHKWDILERLFEFEEKYNKKLTIPHFLRISYETHEKEKMERLLRRQVQSLIKEGKSKEEIIEHFQLTEEEWNECSQQHTPLQHILIYPITF